jgi:hypothetical protein
MFTILHLSRNNKVVQREILPQVQQSIINNDVGYLDFIRVQLYAGKDRFGKNIRPSYLEDVGPGKFLKTRKQAVGYAKWKAAITPNKDRDFFTPNLIINGFFYSSMKLQIKKSNGSLGALYIDSNAGFAQEVFQKYGIPPFQLQTENKNEFVENRIRPQVNKYVYRTLSMQ